MSEQQHGSRPDVFLDGRFLTRGEARVSALDAGFQHGVGLFETMTAVNVGEPGAAGLPGESHVDIVHVDWHMERLAGSAAALGLTEALDVRGLQEAAYLTVEKSGLCDAPGSRARVRLTVTGGDLSLLAAARNGQEKREYRPTVLIQAQPATVYPKEMFEQGVVVAVSGARANPFEPTAGFKTLNYWWRLKELQAAAALGAGEALVFSISNHLCGGCVSNCFVVKDGVVSTPIARGEEETAVRSDGDEQRAVLPSPVLAGVTRRFVVEQCLERGIDLRKRMVTVDDVLGADEVFLTNSSWGVLPVRAVEGREIGGADRGPGDVTRAMREAWENRLVEA